MPQASEFSKLIDLAVSQGVSHSSVLSDIHERILDRYQTMYPSKPQTVEVLVNEKNGAVKLLVEGSDVTPEEFRPLAEKIARETAIEAIQTAGQETQRKGAARNQAAQSSAENKKFLQAISKFLFLVYNSFYLVLVVICLINLVTNQSFRTNFVDFIGDLSSFRLVVISLVASVPLISIVTAIWQQKIKKQAFHTGKLFFTFELPSIVLGVMLFNIIRQPSPAIAFFVTILLTAIPIVYLHLTGQKPKNKNLAAVDFFFQQNLVITLIYLTGLYSFVLPPIIALAINSIRFDLLYFDPVESLIMFLIGSLYIALAGFFLALPFLASFLAFKTYLKTRQHTTSNWGYQLTQGLTFVSLAIFVVLAGLVSYQPKQDKLIEQLASINQLDSFEQRKEIASEMMVQETKVKRILNDAKNLGQRYLFTKDSDFFADAYEQELGVSSEMGLLIQATFEVLAYPFVYQGSEQEVNKALANFKYLFGEDADQYKRFVQTPEVIVDNRKITVTTDYDQMLATVTVDETYSNSTMREQEVVYEFFVEGTAVMHDLKLGPNLEFEGIVAPSGAARKLYNQEVSRTRDPALLEQVGPKQYRLSVFPVPGKNDRITLNGKPQRVQFSYTTTLTPRGFALPNYTQERNVDSVQEFSLTLDGETTSGKKTDTFVTSDAIQAATTKLCQAGSEQSTRTDLGIGVGYLVTSASCDTPQERDMFAAVSGKKIALVQDVSYQNKNNQLAQQLSKYLDQNLKLLTNNQFDLFQYNDLLSAPITLTASNYPELFGAETVYFGSSDFAKVIDSLNLEYDLIFLWTNADEADINQLQPNLSSPLYIIHSDTIFPYGSKLMAELWRTNGDVFVSWNDAKEQAAIALNSNLANQSNRQLLAHDVFFKLELQATNIEPSSQLQDLLDESELSQLRSLDLNTDSNDPLSYLMAQRYIQDQYRQKQTQIVDYLYLDKIHQLSEQAGVVSPYSSYIALVNQRQLDDLERFSDQFDRYQEDRAIGGGFISPPRSVGMFSGPQFETFNSSSAVIGLDVAPETGNAFSLGFSSFGFGGYIALFIGVNVLLAIIGGGVYFVNKKIKVKKAKKD